MDSKLDGTPHGRGEKKDATEEYYLKHLLDMLLSQVRRQTHITGRHIGAWLDRSYVLYR